MGCKFPTEKITGAQYFNSGPKFLQNGGFSNANFVLFPKNFGQEKIFQPVKIKVGQLPLPSCQ